MQHISAVPIVDDSGKLVANLSAHDIRVLLFHPQHFTKLSSRICDSLDMSRPLFTCQPQDSLASVIDQLVNNHIHRLYLTNADLRVIGVVSLRDVIAQFVREPEDSTIASYFDE